VAWYSAKVALQVTRHRPTLQGSTRRSPSTGTLIFNISGNKYRLIARVDFEEQVLYIQQVMTHEQYAREDF
jgi:mRNA-degrading endonuclease HigB of HigAB toxin-antitoxin module